MTKEIAKATDDSKREELEHKEQKATAKEQEEKTQSQMFKIFEVLGESGPQVILQVAILLKTSVDLNSLYGRRLWMIITQIH